MNRFRSAIVSPLISTVFGLACGCVFMLFGAMSPTFQGLLLVGGVGVLVLLVLAQVGLLREALLFGFGFAIVINPRKFFGVESSQELLGWTVTVHFITLLDLAAIGLLVLYGRNILSNLRRLVPRVVQLAVAAYVLGLFASLFHVVHWDEAWAHLVFEGKCILLAIAVFSLLVSHGSGGVMAMVRPLLIGISCAVGVECMIVGLEYTGVITSGDGFAGIRVGSFREMLDMGETLRVGGTYQHPNYLAVAAGALFLFLWQVQIDSHKNRKPSLLYWIGIVGGLVCLVLPLSRGGWLGTAVGGLIYVLIMLGIRGGAWIKSLPWKYVGPSLFLVCAAGLYFMEPIYDKLFYSSAGNISGREKLNAMTLEIVSNSPWTGAGIAQHGFAMEEISGFNELYLYAGLKPVVHNSYLLILSELGIPTTIIFFLLPLLAVGYGIHACIRAPNHELTGLLCASISALAVFLVADLFGMSLRKLDLAYLFWILMGIAYAVIGVIRDDIKKGGPVRRRMDTRRFKRLDV